MAKYIHFGSQCCQKYALYPKMLQVKVVECCILYKKLSDRIRLSYREVELGGFKDCYLLKYYNVQKWESRLTLGLHAVISKNNTSNKSCRSMQVWQLSIWKIVLKRVYWRNLEICYLQPLIYSPPAVTHFSIRTIHELKHTRNTSSGTCFSIPSQAIFVTSLPIKWASLSTSLIFGCKKRIIRSQIRWISRVLGYNHLMVGKNFRILTEWCAGAFLGHL